MVTPGELAVRVDRVGHRSTETGLVLELAPCQLWDCAPERDQLLIVQREDLFVALAPYLRVSIEDRAHRRALLAAALQEDAQSGCAVAGDAHGQRDRVPRVARAVRESPRAPPRAVALGETVVLLLGAGEERDDDAGEAIRRRHTV